VVVILHLSSTTTSLLPISTPIVRLKPIVSSPIYPMARPTITIPAPSQAPTPTGAFPDSPRAGSESPPPDGPGGELELELLRLTHALYNLGTTAVLDLTRDQPEGGKPVGARVNDVVKALAAVDRLSDDAQRVMIPIEVLREIDAGANPSRITSQRIERAVGENQFMNGKITAVQVSAFPRFGEKPGLFSDFNSF
jgi:mediator of RNA polymerase II transcription subunit 10